MQIYNYGTLEICPALTQEGVDVVMKAIAASKKGKWSYLDPFEELKAGDTSYEISEVLDSEFEGTLQDLVDMLAPLGFTLNGSFQYYGDYDGVTYLTDNKIEGYDEAERWQADATDEEIFEVLKDRGYDTSALKKDAATKEPYLMGEIETSAGILRAYRNSDPDQPGICVMLQPAGYEEEIDAAFVSVYENSEYQTGDKERPEDVVIMSYGDATSEDYTVKEIIRREDVIAGLGTGGKA